MDQTLQVHMVHEHDWPGVCTLLVNSLCDLEFYKDIEQDPDTRRDFLRQYLDVQYRNTQHKHSTEFFWCLKRQENPCNCLSIHSKKHVQHSDLVMAAKLGLPRGFELQKPAGWSSLTTMSAGGMVIRETKEDSDLPRFGPELEARFPEACAKLQAYSEWFQKYIGDITEACGSSFWQGWHISVAPEFRMRGIAADGLKEAIRHFSPLADATEQLLVINTGVKICRFVCKNAGFKDALTATYQSKNRWVMLLDMRDITTIDTGFTTAAIERVQAGR